MLKELEKLGPALAEKLMSTQAVATIDKQKSALIKSIDELKVDYIKAVETMHGAGSALFKTLLPKDIALTPTLAELLEYLGKIEARMIRVANTSWEPKEKTKMTDNLLAAKKYLEDMIKLKGEYNSLDKDGIKTMFESLKAKQEQADLIQKTQDEEKKFQEELFKLKKRIIKEDINSADAIKLKIKLYEEYSSVAESSESTIKNLRLDSLKEETDLRKKLSALMVSGEVDLFKMRGASESQANKLKIELESQLGLNQDIESKLKNQLSLEKAITQEKIKGNLQLSAESVKLAEIGQKYGARMAQDISKVLSGEISFDVFKTRGGELQKTFKDFFSSELTNLQATDYLKKRGAGIDVKEREQLVPKVISDWRTRQGAVSQSDLIKEKLKQIIPESIVLPKVDIKTIVESINITLPKGSLDNLAINAGAEVIKALKTNDELAQVLASNIRKYI